ncbi:hypothetical protein SODALDRAFT_356626 [Sodiomyces alkalinus F11]|uniref:Uncharacterized protein n=1 Tax=Sodiomyces alkalinus (strain CBS 110278 / VKM F-3762 / F11) TaxID=1314773 RepID=A0A3N2Q1N3_SODAK|nr:hypothetical protein SODALDRAFT_356626 [Sodiomyces alkalinus F11]ROT40616.1 hypothetical protein SODALDRAFT_356626 [Sodiomyces alkalinus F11]
MGEEASLISPPSAKRGGTSMLLSIDVICRTRPCKAARLCSSYTQRWLQHHAPPAAIRFISRGKDEKGGLRRDVVPAETDNPISRKLAKLHDIPRPKADTPGWGDQDHVAPLLSGLSTYVGAFSQHRGTEAGAGGIAPLLCVLLPPFQSFPEVGNLYDDFHIPECAVGRRVTKVVTLRLRSVDGTVGVAVANEMFGYCYVADGRQSREPGIWHNLQSNIVVLLCISCLYFTSRREHIGYGAIQSCINIVSRIEWYVAPSLTALVLVHHVDRLE